MHLMTSLEKHIGLKSCIPSHLYTVKGAGFPNCDFSDRKDFNSLHRAALFIASHLYCLLSPSPIWFHSFCRYLCSHDILHAEAALWAERWDAKCITVGNILARVAVAGDSTVVNVKWIASLGLSLPCWLIGSSVNTTAGKIHKACKCCPNIRLGVCMLAHACEALKVFHNALRRCEVVTDRWIPTLAQAGNSSLHYKNTFLHVLCVTDRHTASIYHDSLTCSAPFAGPPATSG